MDPGKSLEVAYKDKVSRRILRFAGAILCFGLFALIITHLIYAYLGKHSKLTWNGSEINIPKGYPDTVWLEKLRLIPVHDTVDVEKLTTKNRASNTKPQIIDGKNVNTGVNLGIIGDNATINSPVQVHPIPSDISNFIEIHPDTTLRYTIRFTSGSRPSQIFVLEFVSLLQKKGYSKMVWSEAFFQNPLPYGFSRFHPQNDTDVEYAVNVER